MAIQRNTIFLILIAAALGSVVLYTETRRAYETQNVVTNPSQQRLFDFEERAVQSLTINKQSQRLRFSRDSEGNWQMDAPKTEPASEASIAFLLSLLASANLAPTIENRDFPLQISTEQLSDFGFDQPLAEILVSLDNGNSHTLILGQTDFSGRSIYAQVDPEPGSDTLDIILVSDNFSNAVNRPFSEWQHQSDEDEATSPQEDVSPIERTEGTQEENGPASGEGGNAFTEDSGTDNGTN